MKMSWNPIVNSEKSRILWFPKIWRVSGTFYDVYSSEKVFYTIILCTFCWYAPYPPKTRNEVRILHESLEFGMVGAVIGAVFTQIATTTKSTKESIVLDRNSPVLIEKNVWNGPNHGESAICHLQKGAKLPGPPRYSKSRGLRQSGFGVFWGWGVL